MMTDSNRAQSESDYSPANRPYDLDEAVLRRFPRRVFCDLPNVSARQQILEVRLLAVGESRLCCQACVAATRRQLRASMWGQPTCRKQPLCTSACIPGGLPAEGMHADQNSLATRASVCTVHQQATRCSRASPVPMSQVMLENETLDENVDLAHVASRTEGFSGSDLKAVCTAAAMRPLRELLKASGKSAQVSSSCWANTCRLRKLC